MAKSIYVEMAKGVGVANTQAETITELLKSTISENKGFKLSINKNKADFYLKPKLIKMGDSYLLAVNKVTPQQEVKFSAKLKAKTMSDIDVVASRVVRSVLTEEPTSYAANVDDVTEDEVKRGTRRYEATKQWSFYLGPAWASNLNSTGDNTRFGFGYVWGMEPQYDLTLAFDWFDSAGSNDSAFRNLYIGLNYFLGRNRHSPFVTADIGYGTAAASDGSSGTFDASNDDASGWTLGAGIGYRFFRTSSVNIGGRLRTNYMTNKTKITRENPVVTSFDIVLYY